jgi:hypothetical protein
MIAEEARHEVFFAEHTSGHWLLPMTRALLGWDPDQALRETATRA